MRIAQNTAEVHMHYFSKSVRTNFENAVGATRQALEGHHLKILSEIDLSGALRKYLAVDLRLQLAVGSPSNPGQRQHWFHSALQRGRSAA
jgi:hypothetical protein